MQRLHDAEAAAREIVARTGGEIRLALPLGLGWPVTTRRSGWPSSPR